VLIDSFAVWHPAAEVMMAAGDIVEQSVHYTCLHCSILYLGSVCCVVMGTASEAAENMHVPVILTTSSSSCSFNNKLCINHE